MVTADFDPMGRHRTLFGQYDGVVRVSYGQSYGSGVLLPDGRTILTAAHLLNEYAPSPPRVVFMTEAGKHTSTATIAAIHPGYDPRDSTTFAYDLALLRLTGPAPVTAERYGLYRSSDEIGQTFTMVGYGKLGTGLTGATIANDGGLRLWAKNRFDADDRLVAQIWGWVNSWAAWGSQLYADFDDGTAWRDATGYYLQTPELGLGLDEGLIAPGDSGSPALIDDKVAGIASAVYGGLNTDIDGLINSSFGDVGVWQRVSHYQQWIDQGMRATYLDAPRRPEEVKKAVAEGHWATNLVYFLVQFHGIRSTPDKVVSVDYATRDGTAMAGWDYLPVSGTLKLYPEENHAVIPVEIIGDNTPEPDEYFYLDVFNPVGGGFAGGVVKLTAVRTILDDDGWLW
jgi:hypothetical protein